MKKIILGVLILIGLCSTVFAQRYEPCVRPYKQDRSLVEIREILSRNGLYYNNLRTAYLELASKFYDNLPSGKEGIKEMLNHVVLVDDTSFVVPEDYENGVKYGDEVVFTNLKGSPSKWWIALKDVDGNLHIIGKVACLNPQREKKQESKIEMIEVLRKDTVITVYVDRSAPPQQEVIYRSEYVFPEQCSDSYSTTYCTVDFGGNYSYYNVNCNTYIPCQSNQWVDRVDNFSSTNYTYYNYICGNTTGVAQDAPPTNTTGVAQDAPPTNTTGVAQDAPKRKGIASNGEPVDAQTIKNRNVHNSNSTSETSTVKTSDDRKYPKSNEVANNRSTDVQRNNSERKYEQPTNKVDDRKYPKSNEVANNRSTDVQRNNSERKYEQPIPKMPSVGERNENRQQPNSTPSANNNYNNRSNNTPSANNNYNNRSNNTPSVTNNTNFNNRSNNTPPQQKNEARQQPPQQRQQGNTGGNSGSRSGGSFGGKRGR